MAALSFAVLIGVGSVLFWQLNALALLTAHSDLAHVSGIPVRWLNYGFVALLTVTVALSIRLLGIILVTSLVGMPSIDKKLAALQPAMWARLVKDAKIKVD
jgi:ABC-type Mn2+/Zn2+ transport system permease subunit